jgi:hypothetical protein
VEVQGTRRRRRQGDQPAQSQGLARRLRLCGELSPGTHRFEVVIAQPGLEATYDLILNSEFTDAAALAAYADHPQHVALKPFIGAVREARQCMDYVI